ncbi:MAG TPA: hypothetical protein VFT62_01475 [Mycobacteriales bacterium]|nr:hypothetical protein [Mycobacteriales bacterium]
MSNTSVAAARFRMPSVDAAVRGLGMLAVRRDLTAHTAAVAAYKPCIDARNGAQGRHRAWSPPV